jgi:hypothetical protein
MACRLRTSAASLDQPGDLFQLEDKVRWPAADREAAVEAARKQELEAAKVVADLSLTRDAAGRAPPKKVKPVRKRKLVDEMRGECAVSIRRACRVFMCDTSTYHYKSPRPKQAHSDTGSIEICETGVRYGYRRVHVLLRREAWCHGQNKTTASWACTFATKRPSRG